MMPRVKGKSVWMDEGGGGDEDDGATLSPSHLTTAGDKDELGIASFKSIMEDDWCMGGGGGGFAFTSAFDASRLTFPTDQHLPLPPPAVATATLLPPHVDSSASCSPTPGFNLDPSQPFFASKTSLSSLLSSVCSTPYDPLQPLFGMTNSLSGLSGQMSFPDLSPAAQFPVSCLPPPQDTTTTTGFENSAFINSSKVIRPLEIFPAVGVEPTLFQKRATNQNSIPGSLGLLGFGLGSGTKRRGSEKDEFDEAGFDSTDLNYDSAEAVETGKGEGSEKNDGEEGNNSNGNSTLTGGGDQKGKKSLMAGRRKRKKLNDRLYMLRSVVPKISKVEVGLREDRYVNIHMFCNDKPGLLISTMRALDNLGLDIQLDIQQAVISCFNNGLALDVFRAEHS